MVTTYVSDNAVLQYLQRAHGLDVQAVREHLAGLAENGVRLGAVAVTVENVKLVLANATVVTVLRPGWPTRERK